MTIKWNKSRDGYAESKCGDWRIVPLCCGTTVPQFYDLFFKGEKVSSLNETQREAKESAERLYEVYLKGRFKQD